MAFSIGEGNDLLINVLKDDIPVSQILWTQWSKQLHPEALLMTTETCSEKLG